MLIIVGSCSGGCLDYNQEKRSCRMRRRGRPDRSDYCTLNLPDLFRELRASASAPNYPVSPHLDLDWLFGSPAALGSGVSITRQRRMPLDASARSCPGGDQCRYRFMHSLAMAESRLTVGWSFSSFLNQSLCYLCSIGFCSSIGSAMPPSLGQIGADRPKLHHPFLRAQAA